MNTIGYYLRPNPTDTAVQAPYLPKLVPNGVANLNDIAEKIAESLSVSEERAKLLIRENFTESLKMALAGYTVDMGALRMKARIPGSMPCEDTPFDPETNACVIELYADGELADAFDTLVPVKLTAEQLRNAIKFSNVMDVGTQHMGEIHGTGEFMILGNGVTLDATGESAKLVDRKSDAELATAEVVSVSKGQRATSKFNPGDEDIAKGSYWLVITTFGLIGETTPRVFRKPVTLVEPIPAPVPKATLRFYPTAGEAKAGGDVQRQGGESHRRRSGICRFHFRRSRSDTPYLTVREQRYRIDEVGADWELERIREVDATPVAVSAAGGPVGDLVCWLLVVGCWFG